MEKEKEGNSRTPARSGFKLKNSSATDARENDREPTSSFLGMSVRLCVCVCLCEIPRGCGKGGERSARFNIRLLSSLMDK